MERDEAISSLHRLAGLMQLQGKTDHASRLHRRAVLAEVTPVAPSISDAPLQEDAMEARFGVQVEIRDERVLPPAVASLVGLAELHGSRDQIDEAIRVMERVIELEEKRVGALDQRLAPHLIALAHYVERSGNVHEANSIRDRAMAISDVAAGDGSQRRDRRTLSGVSGVLQGSPLRGGAATSSANSRRNKYSPH